MKLRRNTLSVLKPFIDTSLQSDGLKAAIDEMLKKQVNYQRIFAATKQDTREATLTASSEITKK
jgi:hypothetical protein